MADDELAAWGWSGDKTSEVTILLLRPDPQELAARPHDLVLIDYWRLLFRARIELAVRRRLGAERNLGVAIRDRIERISPTAFEEIRSVLRQEGYLLPPRDNASVYTEFAAVFLELRSSPPCSCPISSRLSSTTRRNRGAPAQDVDARSILASTRPAEVAYPFRPRPVLPRPSARSWWPRSTPGHARHGAGPRRRGACFAG